MVNITNNTTTKHPVRVNAVNESDQFSVIWVRVVGVEGT